MASHSPEKFKDTRSRLGIPEAHRKAVAEPFKAKNCFFYKDGDTKFKAVKMCIHPRRYQRMEALITELSAKVKLPFGVRSIFTPRGRDMITSLDKLENGESYVCSPMRHMARGLDTTKVLPPPRWYYDKPSSGTRELKSLLQEYEFEDRSRFVGRRYLSRDARMAEAYNKAQPKKITVLKNGEPTVRHVVLINRRTAQMFEQILSDLSGMFGLAVRKLYTIEGRKITNLTAMINGPDVLVAAGKEPFKTLAGFVYDPNDRESRLRSRQTMGSKMDMNDRVASRLKKRRDRMARTRGNWKVWCTTNELPTAGTNAQVTITVYGHKGNTGPVPLGFPDKSGFNPGQVDEFDLSIGTNIGEIYKIRIGHDNTGPSPEWFCDEVRMQDVDTGEMLVFPCRRWLSRDEEDHEICREMPAIRKGEPHLPVIQYEVAVTTGDLWNAGTDANVYLTIYGDRGDAGVRQLFVAGAGSGTARTARTAGSESSSTIANSGSTFRKGQTTHFTVEAVSLGHLKRIIVGHDGTAPGDGWYLERLSVQEPDAKPHEVYQFYCGRWLDEGEDDGKIVRELKVQDEYMDDILEKRNWEYEKWKFDSKNQVVLMSMLTGKALRIKPDGTVDGLGEETDLGSMFIVSSKKPMVRVFTSMLNGNFHMAIDHGKVTGQGRGGPQCEFRIHVQSDRTVMLEGAKSPLQFISLLENGKLGDSRSTLDKDPAKRFHVYCKGVLRHRGVVMLKTSNTQAVSVDHDKSIYGTGRCNRAAHFRCHKVDQGRIRMFESMIYPGFYLRFKDGKFDCNGGRNEESHFLIEKHKDKGYFTVQAHKQRGMYIGFTPKGAVRPTVDTGTNNIRIFPEIVEYGTPKKQLALDERLMPISEKSGISEESPDLQQRPDFEEGDYQVLVSTDQSLEYGQVILHITGDKGNTGPVVLAGPPDNGPLFTRGSTDEFRVNLAKVGKLLKARLELVPNGQTREPSWKVQNLILVNLSTQEKYTFDFNKWLSRDKEDQCLVRELPLVVAGKEKESLPVVTYFVTVFTGKDPGSETDALVYLNMFGDLGDSGRRELRQSNRAKPFAKGQSDTFEVEAVHLGNLSRLQIGHDETRPGKGWFLEKVVVREGKTANMEFIFSCGRWLDSGKEDRKLERLLMVQEPAPSKITEVRELSRLSVLPPISTTPPASAPSPSQQTLVTTEFEAEATATSFEPNNEEPETEEVHDEPLTEVPDTKIQGTSDDNLPDETDNVPDDEMIYSQDDEEETEDNEIKLDEEEEEGEPLDEEEGEDDDIDTMPEDEAIPVVKAETPKAESPQPLEVNVQLTTHTTSDLDMNDSVLLYLYGQDGCLGPLMVGSQFKPGETDSKKIRVEKSVGPLYKIRIGLAEEVPGCQWCLDKLKVTEPGSGEEFDLSCGSWMSRTKEDCDVWRELPVPGHQEPPLPVIVYLVEVHTSDIPGADTDAALYVNLVGQRGDSGKRRLYISQTEGKMFSQGKIDRFAIQAVSLGQLRSVVLGHTDKRSGCGAHIDYVAVQEFNSEDEEIETFFPCGRWLDAGQDDGLTERELHPGQRPKAEPRPAASGEYRMWVTTADDSKPSCGGQATLTVYGTQGVSDDIQLFAPSSTAHLFEPANADEFEVSTGDIGEIYKIRITREDNPDWEGWHLEEVKMEDKQSGQVFAFPFERWLSRKVGDGDLSCELPVVQDGQEPLQVKKYEIMVATGDHWAAETDADVWLTIHGSRGDAGKRLLHKSTSGQRCFKRGGEDTFIIEAVDLDDLETLEVEHTGKGAGAGWYLEYMSVMEQGLSSARNVFPCARWLDQGEDDGKTHRVLRKMELPKLSVSQAVPTASGGRWKARIRTSDLPNAGTHAQVYLTVHGLKGASHPLPLGDGSPGMNHFLPGTEAEFDVTLVEDLGEITKVRLEHDNLNSDPAWHVDWVQMKHLDSGFDCLFSFNRWLAEDQEDGQLFRECALETPGWMPLPVLHYIILIQTGRKPQAGASGGVCTINLIGSNGDTGQQLLQRPLITPDNAFREGSLDVYMLEAVSVGFLSSVRLGFEGRGRANKWYVESVRVMESMWAVKESFFTADCWLDDQDISAVNLPITDSQLASSLPNNVPAAVLGHSFPLSKGSWDLWVWTGNQSDASPEEPIALTLYGTTGPSQAIQLNENDEFKPGSCVHSKVQSGSIGELFKVRLTFTEKIGNSSWFIERMKLKDTDTLQEFNFTYNNWMQSTSDNQDGMVELPATRPDIAPLPESVYKVQVMTGDVPCAETTAEVTLMLIGEWGDSGHRVLSAPRSGDLFRRGQVDEFELRLLSLGRVSRVLLGHGEHGRGQGWYPAQVAVTYGDPNNDSVQAVFPCHRWLDSGVDDRKTMREFSALGTINLKDMVSSDIRMTSGGIWTVKVSMAAENNLDVSSQASARSQGVSLVVYGTKGAKGPIELGKFEPGQTETIKGVDVGDVGELSKIRVSCGIEGDSDSFWTVEKVILLDETTRERLEFDFSNCVGTQCGDARRERPVIRPGVPIQPLVNYDVRVDTENVPDASTSAQVYVTLYGSRGDSGRRLLLTEEGTTPFSQGQRQHFNIEAVDLGDLEKIVVTKGPGDPWLLNQVVVKAGQFGSVEQTFIWSNWIGDSARRSEQMEITIPLISSRPTTVAVPTSDFPDFPVTRGQWTVETHTGIERAGPADGIVIVFCGSKGESSPIDLKPMGQNPFQSGASDIFAVSLSEDVGDLIKMRIGFKDNSEPKSWDLKKIHFEDADTKDTFWSSFAQPLAVTDVSDGWTEFPVVWPGIFILPVIKYEITVMTADSPGASTDQTILVKIDGQTGSTGPRELKDTGQRHFQQGQTDTFIIEAVSLLNVESLTIGHSSETPGDGWFLLRATVKPVDQEDEYIFICNRWLDAGQDDGATMRKLYPSDGSEDGLSSAQPTARSSEKEPIENTPIEAVTVAEVAGGRHSPGERELAEAQYQEEREATPNVEETAEHPKPNDWRVYIQTSNAPDSGTRSQVMLTVIGSNGQVGPIPLNTQNEDSFETGQTDQFDIQLDQEEIGYIRKVRLQHDNTGSVQGWRVDTLSLEHRQTGEKHNFAVNKWLSYKGEYGDVVFEAGVASPDGPALETCHYLIKTVTETEEDAGTEANAFITLVGNLGDSGKRYLMNDDEHHRKFLAGKTDTFTVEAVDLGDLDKVIVGHDGGSEERLSWKLQCVMVRKLDPNVKESTVFPWGRPVISGPDNHVTITISNQTIEQSKPASPQHKSPSPIAVIADTNDVIDHAPLGESNTGEQNDEEKEGEEQDEDQLGEELHLNLPQTQRTEQNGTNRTDEGYQDSEDIHLGDDSTYRTEDGTERDPDADNTEDPAMFTASDNDTERELPPPGEEMTARDEVENAQQPAVETGREEEAAGTERGGEPAGTEREEEPAGTEREEEPAVTEREEEPAGTEREEEPTGTDQKDEPASTEREEEPAGTDQKDEPASTEQEEEPAGTEREEEPAGTERKEEPAGTEQEEEPAGTDQKDEPASTEQEEEPAGTERKEEPAGTEREEEPAGTEQEEEPAGTDQKDEPASTEREEEPAATEREEEPAGTEREEEPAATEREEEPSSTEREEVPAGTEREEEPAGTEREEPAGTEREEEPAGTEREEVPVGTEREEEPAGTEQ